MISILISDGQFFKHLEKFKYDGIDGKIIYSVKIRLMNLVIYDSPMISICTSLG